MKSKNRGNAIILNCLLIVICTLFILVLFRVAKANAAPLQVPTPTPTPIVKKIEGKIIKLTNRTLALKVITTLKARCYVLYDYVHLNSQPIMSCIAKK